MTLIDTAILDLTEWLCRRFQVLTGRTNVWLAVQLTNLSIIVYFVWAGVVFWRSDPWVRAALGPFCGGLLYVLTQTVFKVSIEAYENSAYHRVAKGLRNPRRVRDALLRISFLTLSIALFYPIVFVYINLRLHIAILTYSLILLTTAVLYLLACDPLPPCAGKVREWLRGSAPSRLAAPESGGGRAELSFRLPATLEEGVVGSRRRSRPINRRSAHGGPERQATRHAISRACVAADFASRARDGAPAVLLERRPERCDGAARSVTQ
jgi:hypothetical protein